MQQLALPASRGLFAQAIAQSGCSMASVDADEAMRITRQVAKGLGVKPTADGSATSCSRRCPNGIHEPLGASVIGCGTPGGVSR
jgi:carboxylesterase type B